MTNVEHLKPPANSDGAVVKLQHLCEGRVDILERLQKLLDFVRGVDRSGFDAMPHEKIASGLEANLDALGRMEAKFDQALSDLETIFYGNSNARL